MKIDRSKPLNELYDFVSEGNGLVVGKPGIGKTFLLRKLQQKLVDNDTLCLTVRIDWTYDSSDKSIGNELELDENWLKTLASIELRNNHKAVLIFDAFDAARDEDKRNGFLRQIKRAAHNLRNKWTILVSVRTYDAAKSLELQNLFGNSNGTNKRQFIVTELTSEEMDSAFAANDTIKNFYKHCNEDLQRILRIPFYLNLLATLFLKASPYDLKQLNTSRSEAQLLELFWNLKVEASLQSIKIQSFLSKFTQSLLEGKSLSAPFQKSLELFDSVDFDVVGHLQREDILDIIPYPINRLAFSHNIIFDYAVSRLCMDSDLKSILEFLEEDYSRAFFLRPSFIYFFTSLWYDRRRVFWRLYFKLCDQKIKEIQLFVRLIITTTIAIEFDSVRELEPILNIGDSDFRNKQIRNLLQSIRFTGKDLEIKHSALLASLSNKLSPVFLYEYAYILNSLLDEGRVQDPVAQATSARKYLNYILESRQDENKAYLDRMAAGWGIKLVTRTFASDTENSSNLIRKIFSIINEPDFEIGYFNSIADSLDDVLKNDPALVRDFYLLVYGHSETSEKKTQMGNSVVLNLISNRRQDFDMVYYRLEQIYPDFLNSDGLVAISTGIEIINKAAANRNTETKVFEINKIPCTYIPDYSVIWSGGGSKSRIETIASAIEGYLCGILERVEHQALPVIEAYIRDAKAGVLWNLLLKLAKQQTARLDELPFYLLANPVLLTSTDTSFEARALLEKISPILTDSQLSQIEESLFGVEDEKSYAVHAALSVIPFKRLQHTWAKNLIETKGVIKNEPPITFSSSVSTYTTQDWLEDRGVNISDPKVDAIIADINYLDGFTAKNLNSSPPNLEYKDYVTVARKLCKSMDAGQIQSDDLVSSMRASISKTLAICARNLRGIDEQTFTFIKSTLLDFYDLITPSDLAQNGQSAERGYSPTPRIDAATVLLELYLHDGDDATLDRYKRAIEDASDIVRYMAVSKLLLLYSHKNGLYKELLWERLKKETDAFVYAVLLSVTRFKEDEIASNGEEFLSLLENKLALLQNTKGLVEVCANILLRFAIDYKSQHAKQILENAYSNSELTNQLVFTLLSDTGLVSDNISVEEQRAIFLSKLELVAIYIDKSGLTLRNIDGSTDTSLPAYKFAFGLFDDVVMRMYFLLQPNSLTHRTSSIHFDDDARRELYFALKPLIAKIVEHSGATTDEGFIVGHTAHYLIQICNSVLPYDPRHILGVVARIIKYSKPAGYTFDSHAIQETVKLTEQLLSDHRDILSEEESFQNLVSVLETLIDSGWVDALKLLWRLDEVFR